MARYIDADLLLTDEKTHTLPIGCGKASGNVVVFVDDIEKLPTAVVQEVRHGRWISNDLGGYKWAYYCSECGWVDGYPFNDRHKYCPNCGTLMDRERE